MLINSEKNQLYSTTVFLFLPLLAATRNCSHYGVCNPYVLAPPGSVPSCAKWGETYCEHIEQYPMQLIKYLIEKTSGFDLNTLFSNESTDDLVFRKPESYGYPSRTQHFYGGPPAVIQPALSYGPLPVNASHYHQFNNFHHPSQNQHRPYNTMQDGYPDRRYKIDLHLLTNALQPVGYRGQDGFYANKPNDGHTYSAPFWPTLYRSELQSIPWWQRYRRSIDSNNRNKRQTASSTVNELCPTVSNFIMPKAALNTRGSWMYTVNLNEIDSRYTQLVRSETCISNECNGLCSLPNGYKSRCEQKYVQKRLVALEGGGNNLYTDTFWFPHCCVCQIISN